jgi:hypothetical protein
MLIAALYAEDHDQVKQRERNASGRAPNVTSNRAAPELHGDADKNESDCEDYGDNENGRGLIQRELGYVTKEVVLHILGFAIFLRLASVHHRKFARV